MGTDRVNPIKSLDYSSSSQSSECELSHQRINRFDLISFAFLQMWLIISRICDQRQLENLPAQALEHFSSSDGKIWERFIHKSHFVGVLASVNQAGKQSTWKTAANWCMEAGKRKISVKKISPVTIRIEEAWYIIDEISHLGRPPTPTPSLHFLDCHQQEQARQGKVFSPSSPNPSIPRPGCVISDFHFVFLPRTNYNATDGTCQPHDTTPSVLTSPPFRTHL